MVEQRPEHKDYIQDKSNIIVSSIRIGCFYAWTGFGVNWFESDGVSLIVLRQCQSEHRVSEAMMRLCSYFRKGVSNDH